MITLLQYSLLGVWLVAFGWFAARRPALRWIRDAWLRRPVTWLAVVAVIAVVWTRQFLPAAAAVGAVVLAAGIARLLRAQADRQLSMVIPTATRTLASLCARCNNLREALIQLPGELRRYEDSPRIRMFDRISERLFCKMPLSEALPVDHTNPDVQVLLLVLRAHDMRGGEIAHSLNQVAGAVEDLNNMRADIRSATEEGRVTLFVVCLVPVLLVVGASHVVSKEAYLGILDTSTGRHLTGIAILLYTTAVSLGFMLGERDI